MISNSENRRFAVNEIHRDKVVVIKNEKLQMTKLAVW